MKRKIGVFDSGMGGLTVLRALEIEMPEQSFVYLGDTARLPYGTKSPDTVRAYAVQMARLLVERGIKVLVIACNTATTAALTHLQALLPDVLVMGVVAPGAHAVACAGLERVGVMATETTLASGAYDEHICASAPHLEVLTKACPLLVALAEEGMVDNDIARLTLLHYLKEFKDIDCLLLGCTHFPVFKEALAELLPAGVTLVDSAIETARRVKDELTKRKLLAHHAPTRQFLVTDSIERFMRVGALFLGRSLSHERIELVHAGDGSPPPRG